MRCEPPEKAGADREGKREGAQIVWKAFPVHGPSVSRPVHGPFALKGRFTYRCSLTAIEFLVRNRMLFSAHSIEFKIAMISIWIFPFAALAGLTRDWRLFLAKLFCSVPSVLLFVVSFFLQMIIAIDFDNSFKMHMSIYAILSKMFFGMFIFFPGLVLVIVAGVLSVALKPKFPCNLSVALLTSLFHLLYLLSVVILTTQ